MVRMSTNNADKPVYRISELVEASGVSRDMIKYYLRAGLLPPAQKPRPNLSLYTDEHLALIGLVRRFQEQTKLSLPDIAELFAEEGHDTRALELRLLSTKGRVSEDATIIPISGAAPDRGELDFPPEFLAQLQAASLLGSSQPGEYDPQLAGLLWTAHQQGVPLEFFQQAQERLAELAELEVHTLIAIKRPSRTFNESMDYVIEVDRVISRWMTAEKSRQILNRFQEVIDNSQQALSTLLDTIYQPSDLFRERHQVARTLGALAADMLQDKAPALLRHELAFACMLLREYDLASELAQATLDSAPNDPTATAIIALVNGVLDNADAAFEYASQLEDCDQDHPAIRQARLLALLLKAGKLGGVTDTTELMKGAADLFLEPADETFSGHPEATLLLARANVAFPDFANSAEQAITALQDMLAALDAGELPLTEVNDQGLLDILERVYRISIVYYLGVLQQRSGAAAAANHCFEQVIQLDPTSNFGQSAYLQSTDH